MEENKNDLRLLQLDPRQPSETVRSIYASECLRCGVCCVIYAQRPFLIAVSESDSPPARLVQIGPRLKTHSQDPDWNTNRYMRIERLNAKQFSGWEGFSKCAALDGAIGRAAHCGIYEDRPRACSEFDPGSPACLRARRWVKMAPPDDVMALGRS